MPTSDRTYLLELRPPAAEDRPELALRRLLKYALRVLGWKCTGVREHPTPSPPDAPAVGEAKAIRTARPMEDTP